MKIFIVYTTIIVFSGLLIFSCQDVLEKENLTAITPDDVWNDAGLSEAYTNGFYNSLMPGMPLSSGNYTDEASGIYYGGTHGNPFAYGTATIDDYNYWPYGVIRNINFLLEKIDTGSLSEEEKDPLKGQAYFWRAWAYFRMVKAYGGVPLILNVQEPVGPDEIDVLQVKRNKTSECIEQIIKDLDQAITKLPVEWDNANIGKIDKCAAKAFKARVLLFYASPQFNPGNIADRWQDAYDAAKEAKEYCESQGKGLYESYAGIWEDELNKEVIMVRRYTQPDATYYVGCPRPYLWSQGCTGSDQATLELVNAFPLIDGTPWDSNTMSYDTLHRHRSDRFHATIGYNGHEPFLKEMFEENTNLWTYIKAEGGHMDSELPSATSFYRVKAMDREVTKATVNEASMDWPEIRFAEVLMTYGEAANEIGKPDEALQVLYDIRKRAGILPGSDNSYGITASTKEDIRQAYMDENYIEFAFEDKRLDQLRRLRKWDERLNSLVFRHGLEITQKEGEPAPSGSDDIDDFINSFEVEVIQNGTLPFDVKPEYYFYGIPKVHLDQNPNLEQTQGWPGGTFDPLE